MSNLKQTQCHQTVKECIYSQQLLDKLMNDDSMTKDELPRFSESYLHLISMHNNTDDFEYIFNKLGICSVDQCDIFKRHQSRRIKTAISTEVKQNIIDKIHCYYYHSFDIGHRFTSKEQQLLNMVDKQKRLKTLYKILSSKHSVYRSTQKLNKYVSHFSNLSTTQVTERKTESNQGIKKYTTYSYGTEFVYTKTWGNNRGIINKKYETLKEELTHNEISVLAVEQFQNEFQKGIINFNTCYRK
eukprot:43104_1